MGQLLAARCEELGEQLGTPALFHTHNDIELMCEARIVTDVVQGTERAAVEVHRAEHHTIDPRLLGCSCAHQTRFERDDKCVSIETPRPCPLRRIAECQHLCVGSRITGQFALVVSGRHHVPGGIQHDGADRDVIMVECSIGLDQCLRHGIGPVGVRHERNSNVHNMSADVPPLDVAAYLRRIGFNDTVAIDLPTLAALQLAHMATVPFENLDVAARTPVRTDLEWSLDKIVHRGRGGWCFEVNGAFSALLDTLGFDVRLLGAAVLLDGPNKIVDHLTLEVTLDRPYLVDVGFGESFIQPLDLTRSGPQPGGTGTYEFMASPQGTTLTCHDDSGIPVPSYRFTRVSRTLEEFTPASNLLSSDPQLHWQNKPFATRLIDAGPDRITLLKDRVKIVVDDQQSETPVSLKDWDDVLRANFGISIDSP